MAYCNQCGKPNESGSRFCSSCGAPLEKVYRAVGQKQAKRSFGERFSDFWNGVFGVWFKYADTSYNYKEEDRQQNRHVALLSYIHVLVLVPLVSMRESPFTQYHANLGLNLLVWEIAAEVVWYLLLHFFGWIPVLGWILWILRAATALVFIGISLFGIRSALKGNARELEFFRVFHMIK